MNWNQKALKLAFPIFILFFAGVAAANCGQCGVGGKKHGHESGEKRKCCTKEGPCCKREGKKTCPTDCTKPCCLKEGLAVNAEAPDFTLTDVNGKKVTLSKLDDKIVVLEWTNYDCPFVKAHYASDKKTTSKLAEKYKDKDVVWLLINSTNSTTAEKTKEWAQKVGLKQTVLIDTDGKVGRSYHAKKTPHLFVIDKDGKVIYQGAMDNAPLGKTKEGEEFVNYVDQALTELLGDKKVSVPKTESYGCSVKYPPKDKK